MLAHYPPLPTHHHDHTCAHVQGAMEETLQEKQFRVEATQEARDTVLGYLKELSTTYPETKDVLSVLLKSKYLSMPTCPAPDTNQRPLSARSDLSDEY